MRPDDDVGLRLMTAAHRKVPRRASDGVSVDFEAGMMTARHHRGSRRQHRVTYSPITAQRKPIMMKKPVNRAMRPSPP